MIYNTNVDLVNEDVYTKFGLILSNRLSKNQIMTLIKGCNSIANLRRTMINDTNVDLVNDNVYTKFCLILSICSQDKNQSLT